MIYLQEFLCHFSLVSLVIIYFFQNLKKSMMALTSPSSSSSSSPLPRPHPPWLGWLFLEQGSSQIRDKSKNNLVISPPKDQKDTILKDNPICIAREKENICVVHPKGLDSCQFEKVCNKGEIKAAPKTRKRPARLVVPEYCPASEFSAMEKKLESKEFEVEGRDYFVASKKGRREVMEDGYGVMLDIMGDSKQAFFTVIDGHGGRAAADYVAENLGKNIVQEIEKVGEAGQNQLEEAIRGGYLVTDKEFLIQGKSGGACAASVIVKDGGLHVANVGDCRVVLSRKGTAFALTNDHRLSREDERSRIENSGGFVHCHNGIWRVNGSLAVSRAIGDLHMKDWIISEPDIEKLPLTSDCEFLIMASDGLWDKVNDQEAVDMVSRSKSSLESCKELVALSSKRGNIDDITVMVINLQNFIAESN